MKLVLLTCLLAAQTVSAHVTSFKHAHKEATIEEPLSTVFLWTRDLLTGLYDSPQQVTKYFNSETMLEHTSKELPFGGVFTGSDIATFMKKFELTGTASNHRFQILAVDEAKGISMVQHQYTFQFTRSERRSCMVKASVLLKWNVANAKLEEITTYNENESEVLNAYYTTAERLFWDLSKSFWKRDTIALSLDDPMWDRFDDQIVFVLNMSPSDYFPRKVWHGKDQLLQAMTAMTQENKLLTFDRTALGDLAMLKLQRDYEMQVLFANENQVIVAWEWKHLKGVKKYRFGTHGLVERVEFTLVTPLRPWELSAYPVFLEAPEPVLKPMTQQQQAVLTEAVTEEAVTEAVTESIEESAIYQQFPKQQAVVEGIEESAVLAEGIQDSAIHQQSPKQQAVLTEAVVEGIEDTSAIANEAVNKPIEEAVEELPIQEPRKYRWSDGWN